MFGNKTLPWLRSEGGGGEGMKKRGRLMVSGMLEFLNSMIALLICKLFFTNCILHNHKTELCKFLHKV